MSPSEFKKLLEKYRSGQATLSEIQKVERWYSVIEDTSLYSDEKDLKRIKKGSLKKILSRKKKAPHRIPTTTHVLWKGTAVAACTLLLVLFLSPFIATKESLTSLLPESPSQSYRNDGKDNKLVILQDGSSVILFPGSQLILNQQFGETERRTLLFGKAFFDIEPNAALPFLVECENVITRVTGTSFTIDSNRGAESLEIKVHSGKVSVFRKEERLRDSVDMSSIQLIAQQKASFLTRNIPLKQWRQCIKQESDPASKKNTSYIFNDVPLGEVFQSLTEEYGIQMTLHSSALHRCTFTGDLTDLSLRERLEIICFSTGTTFSAEDDKVTIKGEGCV